MRVSARCDYACKALLELSLHWPNEEPLQIHTISDRQNIPLNYLIQILIQLKRVGFVESSRGKEGGYKLAKLPGQISLGEVIRQITGRLLPLAEAAKGNGSVFSDIWSELEDVMTGMLDKITFEDISNKAKGTKKAIVYQI
ncbi:MAG: Rrf2 family transcriptional regulator [Candidatus Omnitrophica bacterium]|nr:Rrf2 family transcriptional regulator [Candidatus Omnitrophota bacterium]